VKGLLLLPLALFVVLLPASIGGAQATRRGSSRVIPQDAAKGILKPAKLKTTKNGLTVTRTMPFLSDSTVEAAEEALGVSAADERAEAADASADVDPDFSDIGGGKETLGCAKRDGKDGVRVNQPVVAGTARYFAERFGYLPDGTWFAPGRVPFTSIARVPVGYCEYAPSMRMRPIEPGTPGAPGANVPAFRTTPSIVPLP